MEHQNKNTINIDGKTIAVIVILFLLIVSAFGMFAMQAFSGKSSSVSSQSFSASGTGSSDYSSLPEKCRPPAGQDISSWKEHLGHHDNIRDCLKYFP